MPRRLRAPRRFHDFTVGIIDDDRSFAADRGDDRRSPKGVVSHVLGSSDGTVGANKDSIKIIGENTDMNAQAYFP